MINSNDYYGLTPPSPKLSYEYQGRKDNWLVFGGGGSGFQPPYDDARFHDAIFITTPNGFNPTLQTSPSPTQYPPPTATPIRSPVQTPTPTPQPVRPPEYPILNPPVSSSPVTPVTPSPPYIPPPEHMPVVQPSQPKPFCPYGTNPDGSCAPKLQTCGDAVNKPHPENSVWDEASCSYKCPSGTHLWYNGSPNGFCEPNSQGISIPIPQPAPWKPPSYSNGGMTGTPPNTWVGGNGWIGTPISQLLDGGMNWNNSGGGNIGGTGGTGYLNTGDQYTVNNPRQGSQWNQFAHVPPNAPEL